jgi:hypothetical protein
MDKQIDLDKDNLFGYAKNASLTYGDKLDKVFPYEIQI